jgi:hypothetical protein
MGNGKYPIIINRFTGFDIPAEKDSSFVQRSMWRGLRFMPQQLWKLPGYSYDRKRRAEYAIIKITWG